MMYDLDLRTAGWVAGLFLLATHGYAWARSSDAKSRLRAFPRSGVMGTALIIVAAAWTTWLLRTMELGEFERYRLVLTLGIPLSAWLLWRYVPEFLAVRALGILMLLAAEPLLEAAFLRPEPSRLLLVTLAYVWIIVGMFWVGMPYLMRDWIEWVTAQAGRWKAGVIAGTVYGALLCLLAFRW